MDSADLAYLKKRHHELIDNCPLCGGRKPFCKCTYAFQFEYAKIRANIPISLRTFDLNDFTHPQLQKQKEAVVEYAKGFNDVTVQDNLYLFGTKGTGKSAIAAWVLEEAMRHKRTGYFFPTVYAAKMAATKVWDRDTQTEKDCVALRKADVIVIDKVGEGTNLLGAAFEELREILRERTESAKITIFVGSVESNHLVGNEQEMVNVCNCREIEFNGFDYKKEVLHVVRKEQEDEQVKKPVTKKAPAKRSVKKPAKSKRGGRKR